MKHLTTGIALATLLMANAAMADGGVIKFGHDNKADPFENPAHACTAVFANSLAAGTNGSVTVEVFGSNQLGTAAEHVQQVRDGILQATLTSTGALASYYPRIDVLNLPFAFADISSTYAVYDGPFGAALARLRAMPWVRGITLMTHFARADDEVGVAGQLATFRRISAGLDYPVSLANSAALLRFPEALGQVARPGIILYGGSPMPALQSAEAIGLRPVMTLTSEIIGVQEIAAGERVGYGGTFVAEGPTRVGVVACGYADGYPRHAPTGTPILVGGRRTRTLGRVSMDMLACDLSHLPEAGVGTPVTLWGEGLAADEVATAAGTISYELFCALAPRVPVVVRGRAA